ncbi:MAG: class I SAM-dependent methyltransferase [Candidatus Margulisbacteria bacterium]|nr:class I SAM-dependent methyltransferase [Candidatus Margulisiibacteriota bacterium]
MEDNLSVWEGIFSQRQWGKYPAVPLIRTIVSFFRDKDRNNSRILELGSGPGAHLWYLAREGFKVYGIEGSPSAVKQSIERFTEEGLAARIGQIIAGDYSSIPFEDNFFDAVIDMESLYCNSFTKSRQIIELAFQKLKPGGLFFSQTFADGTWGIEGQEIDYHAFVPIEGPMAQMGFTRYTTYDDIEKLYKLPQNKIVNIERYDRNLMNGKAIKEWAIELHKT